MMNKEINIEDLRPIAVVDYNTIDDIKDFMMMKMTTTMKTMMMRIMMTKKNLNIAVMNLV